MTPEGKVKAAVKAVLARHTGLYHFMPVPYGIGESSLDFIICFRGVFIAVETKVPGKSMTPRQNIQAGNIAAAGGAVFEIASHSDVERFAAWLDELAATPEIENVISRSDGERDIPKHRRAPPRRRGEPIPIE
jgi:hypothetical protein